MRTLFAHAAVVLTLVLTLGFQSVANAQAGEEFTIVKVADGVYAAIAKPGGLASGNAGFVVGETGVLVFDTFFTPFAMNQLLDAIKRETKLPVKYVVNSHYHLDHTGGNQVLAELGVPIIAHDNVLIWQTTKNRKFLPAPSELEKRRADVQKQLAELPSDQTEKRTALERQLRRYDAMATIKLTNPNVTFSRGEIHLFLGSREVVLSTLPGHTGGDVLAYVPDATVVFTGDMAWRKTLPNLVDATVNDWIPSLETILSRYPTARFVPGHGDVASIEDIHDFHDYLSDLRTRVKQGIGDGLSLDVAKQKLTLREKYKSYGFQNFAIPNVEDMYKELSGTKQTSSP